MVNSLTSHHATESQPREQQAVHELQEGEHACMWCVAVVGGGVGVGRSVTNMRHKDFACIHGIHTQ